MCKGTKNRWATIELWSMNRKRCWAHLHIMYCTNDLCGMCGMAPLESRFICRTYMYIAHNCCKFLTVQLWVIQIIIWCSWPFALLLLAVQRTKYLLQLWHCWPCWSPTFSLSGSSFKVISAMGIMGYTLIRQEYFLVKSWPWTTLSQWVALNWWHSKNKTNKKRP